MLQVLQVCGAVAAVYCRVSAKMPFVKSLGDYFVQLNDYLMEETWEASEKAVQLLSINDEHAKQSCLRVS